MNSHSSSLIKKLDKVSDAIGNAVSYLLLLMVTVSVIVVIMRYLLNIGSIAMQESITYMHASIFILAAASTLKQDGHVRVDIFYHRMSVKSKARVNLFGTLFLLFPFCIYTISVSYPYIESSWRISEASPEAGGIAAVYLLKSLILVLVVSLLFQGTLEAVKNILFLLGKGEDPLLEGVHEADDKMNTGAM